MNFYWKSQGTHPSALGCSNWLESHYSTLLFPSVQRLYLFITTLAVINRTCTQQWINELIIIYYEIIMINYYELINELIPMQWMLVATTDMLICGTAPHTPPPCPYNTFTSPSLLDGFSFKLNFSFSFMLWVDFADVEIKQSLTRQLLAIVQEVCNRNSRWLQFAEFSLCCDPCVPMS